jgi:hypothetical protein
MQPATRSDSIASPSKMLRRSARPYTPSRSYWQNFQRRISVRSQASRTARCDNSAAYLSGWLRKLKDDRKLIVHAAGQAQRACDNVLNQTPVASSSAAPALCAGAAFSNR